MDIESEYDQIPTEIFCIFKTAMPEEYRLSENPISIPTNFTETSLSDLINQMLTEKNELSSPSSEKFEILINNELLRGTLKSHIMKNNISSEKNLVIHYCLALNKPKLANKTQIDDWISSISLLNQTAGALLVGSFNGEINLFEAKGGEILGKGEIKGKSLKTMLSVNNFLNLEQEYSNVVYSGHSDEILRVTLIDTKTKRKNKKLDFVTKIYGKGHNSSIESLDIHPLNNAFVASGSYNGELALWQIKEIESLPENQGVSIEGSHKKLKVSPIKEMKPNHKTQIHHDNLSRIVWLQPETLITGSMDHNIKLFDVEKTLDFETFNCRDTAITALTAMNTKTIISGHEDGYLRLWDLRDKKAKKLIKGHAFWTSQAKSMSESELIYATAGYDKAVKVWDLRSEFPLFTMKSHGDKVFCLEWNGIF